MPFDTDASMRGKAALAFKKGDIGKNHSIWVKHIIALLISLGCVFSSGYVQAGAADESSVSVLADESAQAKAIFSLFSTRLRLPQDMRAIHKALEDVTWLNQTQIDVVDLVAGLVPVDLNLDDSVFVLRLFPNAKMVRWVIYLRISGRNRTVEEVRALLTGAATLNEGPQLLEFALCYPNGRVERFSDKGKTVF